MRFKYKLGLALLAAGMIPIGVVSKLNLDDLEAFSRSEAILSAEASLTQKAKIVTSYFESVIDFGEVVTAMDELPTDIAALNKNARYLLKRDTEVTPSDALLDRYTYQQENTEFATAETHDDWLRKLDAQAIALQELYIAQNPNDIGKKELLDNAGDGSSYSRLHAKTHPMFREYLQSYGFYDIFLIEPDAGRIVYSVYKEVDFGTSLIDGPFADTAFGRAAQTMLREKGAQSTIVADFEPYAPSYGVQAAFILFAVGSGEDFAGIFAVQLPLELVAAIVAQAESATVANKAFLVASDGSLRSNHSFAEGLTIGHNIDPATEAAVLASASGADIITEADNDALLTTWSDLGLEGVDWKIVSQVDYDQVMHSSDRIRDKSLKTMGIFALLITIFAALLTRYLLAPIRKVTEIASSEATQSLGTLSRTSREAREASMELASAAQETQRQVSEVNERTSKVNADVTDVAVAIEELSAALETVSRSVEKTTSLTEVSASKAEIASVAGEDLSKAAADIAGVVTLIEEIARQTKLLSINAGIEAANAGQWGTGFKVLSGEIGKLAARTTQSTTEIAAQIDAVTSLIQKSLVANEEISGLISEVNDQAQNISASANEQKKATEQIAERMRRTMTNVEVSNENLQTVKKASERSAASAEQLLAGVGEVDSATKSMGNTIDHLSLGLRAM